MMHVLKIIFHVSSLDKNPLPEQIVEKINELKLQKPVSRKQKVALSIAILTIGGILALLSYRYSNVIFDLSFGYREFLITILGAGIGIGFMFLKKVIRGTAEKKTYRLHGVAHVFYNSNCSIIFIIT